MGDDPSDLEGNRHVTAAIELRSLCRTSARAHSWRSLLGRQKTWPCCVRPESKRKPPFERQPDGDDLTTQDLVFEAIRESDAPVGELTTIQMTMRNAAPGSPEPSDAEKPVADCGP
jgi:hypothetical protein